MSKSKNSLEKDMYSFYNHAHNIVENIAKQTEFLGYANIVQKALRPHYLWQSNMLFKNSLHTYKLSYSIMGSYTFTSYSTKTGSTH